MQANTSECVYAGFGPDCPLRALVHLATAGLYESAMTQLRVTTRARALGQSSWLGGLAPVLASLGSRQDARKEKPAAPPAPPPAATAAPAATPPAPPKPAPKGLEWDDPA